VNESAPFRSPGRLDFIVVGHDAEKVRALAKKLGVPYLAFSVDG